MKYNDLEQLAQQGKLLLSKTEMRLVRERTYPLQFEITQQEYERLLNEDQNVYCKIKRHKGRDSIVCYKITGYETKRYPVTYYQAQTADMGHTYWKINAKDYKKLLKNGAVENSKNN